MESKIAIQIVKEYKEGLQRLLGDDLLDVFLYGSQARGTSHPGSDIDVLCLMKVPQNYGELIKRSSELTSSLSLKYDVILSRTFVTKADFDNRQLPFYMNVRKDHVTV
ncbi:MAG: nucleotidyltransferase domain-containing protein [Nitrospinae bacterium]|nr:nucleotidyltransferase domain-containing protein [Nitrospinota bacterium]